MPEYQLIALDLDGTLLTSAKTLSEGNRRALEEAAGKGIRIVPTTGRFYGGMPAFIRELPFITYAITINGARVENVKTGETLYASEIPNAEAIGIMSYLDTLPVIYDCYMGSAGYMTEALQNQAEAFCTDPHYIRMLHTLRQPVPELKRFLRENGRDVQKIQFFTQDARLREELLRSLETRFPALAVSSSTPENVEINALHANKGEALEALAAKLGIGIEQTVSFGDGLNDVSMLKAAGLGVAMANSVPGALEAANAVTLSNDEDGVAAAIRKYCL